MVKVIKFDNCIDCPFGKEDYTSLTRTGAMCPMIASYKGRWMWRLVWDAYNPPEDCPFPKGVIVPSCKQCPYVEENYGDYFCPKIEEKMLDPIKDPDKFHRYCPLEGKDCDMPEMQGCRCHNERSGKALKKR